MKILFYEDKKVKKEVEDSVLPVVFDHFMGKVMVILFDTAEEFDGYIKDGKKKERKAIGKIRKFLQKNVISYDYKARVIYNMVELGLDERMARLREDDYDEYRGLTEAYF